MYKSAHTHADTHEHVHAHTNKLYKGQLVSSAKFVVGRAAHLWDWSFILSSVRITSSVWDWTSNWKIFLMEFWASFWVTLSMW